MKQTAILLALSLPAAFAGVRVNVHIGVGHPVHRVMPQVLVLAKQLKRQKPRLKHRNMKVSGCDIPLGANAWERGIA